MGVLNALKGQNPEAVANTLMQTNPQFKSFVEANKGKSVEQIAQENGIDLEQIKQFLK
jgi:LysM repeat protein